MMRTPAAETAMPRSRTKLFPTPDDAENAFYDAFERANIALMMSVWAESDDIVCIHPQGPRLSGFEAVRESWVQIFSGGAQLRVGRSELRKFDGNTVAVHQLVELVSPPGEGAAVTSIFATNVYELSEAGWRMIVHHAAPAPDAQPRTQEPTPPAHTLH
jgi:ketosteroid isomerase-like protein